LKGLFLIAQDSGSLPAAGAAGLGSGITKIILEV
jgi:hypothetical protein